MINKACLTPFILPSVFRQLLQQLLRSGRRLHLARENVLRLDQFTVVFLVGLIPGADNGSLQGNTGEDSLAEAVRIHRRTDSDSGLDGAPDGTGRNAEGTPESDVAPL